MSDFTKSRISGSDNYATPKELYDELEALKRGELEER